MAKDFSFNLKFNSNGDTVINNLQISAENLSKAISSVQKSMNKSLAAITRQFSLMSVVFNNGLRGLEHLSSETISFDQAMRKVNTMASKSGGEMEALTKQVKNLSRAIPIARDLLAEGLYQTISNGVPEDNWISFLETSARSSVGGIADLNEVVKVTSTIIKNYGYSWEDAAAIQDKIQLTAKNGVTSFEQLAQALPKVTGNAATLGVQIDELMATFSTLTGVSGNTSEVATQLGAIFTSLVKPSKEAQKMAKVMGIEFNAASIKAADGLQNFLASLDHTVKKFAEANGVLEQAVYGKLFGSAEALRAIGPLIGNLSEKFSENIDAMADSAGTMNQAFNEMGGAVQSTSQKIQNWLQSMTDSLGKVAGTILPFAQLAFNSGMAIGGLTAIFKVLSMAVMGLIGVVKTLNLVSKTSILLGKTAHGLLSIMPASIKRFALGLEMLSASSRKASIAVNVLKFTIKGLIAATGIGLAFVAISSAISLFSRKTDEAKEKTDDSKKAFNDWKESLRDTSTKLSEAIVQEMTQLERLYKTATNETKSREERLKAAKELKETYKDTFENLKQEEILVGKAAKAYDALKKSIIEAATVEAARGKIKENMGSWLEIQTEKKKITGLDSTMSNDEILAKAGETEKRYREAEAAYRANPTKELEAKYNEASTEWAKYAKAAKRLTSKEMLELSARETEIKRANMDLEKIIATAPIPATATNNIDDLLAGDKDKDAKKTLKQQLEARLSAAKDQYVQASIKGNEKEAQSLQAVIDNLKTEIDNIERIEKMADRPKSLTILGDINKEIQYQRALRENATAETIADIDREIERLEALRDKIEEASVSVKPIEQIQSYDDINKALDYYNKQLNKATTEEERERIQRLIHELQRLKVAWDESLAEVDAPGDVSTLKTEEEIDKAISYWENRLKKAAPGMRAAVQKTLNGLYDAKANLDKESTIQNYQDEIDKLKILENLDNKALTMRIRLMGADQINSKIKDMKAMLMDPDIPENLKEQLKGVISQWEQYKGLAQSSTEVATQGLSIVGKAFTDLGGIFDDALGKWLSYVGQMMESISKLIPAIMAVTAAHAAESAAQTPIVGWLAVGGAIAATIASFAQIPKFAAGGIAYGPTVGMFGEYPGASNNPEVVAPLDRLRSLIQPQGMPAGKVEFEIHGRVIKGVLKAVENLSDRS